MTYDHRWLCRLLLSTVFISKIVTAVDCNGADCDPNASCLDQGSGDVCVCNSPNYVGSGTECNFIGDPNATFSGNYIYNQVTMDFDKAETYCNSQYSTNLASIQNVNEATEASNLCTVACWIGLTDRDQEGNFRWIDGSSFSYNNWHPNEPNDQGGEDCTQIRGGDNMWNDMPCTHYLTFLCNKENAPTNYPTAATASPSNYPSLTPTEPSAPPTFDPLSIICTEQSPCDGTINCVPDQECKVYCNGDHSCLYNLNIDGRSATRLEVVGNGEHSLVDPDVKIYCPDNGPHSINAQASCFLTLVDPDIFVGTLDIYAVEGFNDVFIDCQAQNCLFMDVTLHCKSDYSASCDIRDPQSNTCSSASICDDYTLTVSPTILTAFPSQYPSNSPTIDPTNAPTNDPTHNPTNDPTKHPTKSPTKYPTASPTNHPTMTPTTPSPTLIINYDPTESPSNPVIFTTDNLVNGTTASQNKDNEATFSDGMYKTLIIIICLGCSIIVCCVIGIIYGKRCKNPQKRITKLENVDHGHYVALQDMNTDKGVDNENNEQTERSVGGEQGAITTTTWGNNTENDKPKAKISMDDMEIVQTVNQTYGNELENNDDHMIDIINVVNQTAGMENRGDNEQIYVTDENVTKH